MVRWSSSVTVCFQVGPGVVVGVGVMKIGGSMVRPGSGPGGGRVAVGVAGGGSVVAVGADGSAVG